DGQGNFGSVDGDSAAAMRYTEIRMAKIAHQLLADLDKETVNFVDNYDGTERIPDVLPTRVPNLLVNGSSGIAVGMATNIPPHNLTEVIDGSLAMIDNPDIDVEGLMEYIPGPDFPTAATISGRSGIVEAYKTGRGRIHLRAQAEVEVDEKTGKETIIVTEIPYQVNKARLIEKIAELVKEKRVEGISALRDESDKDGMRIVIEIRRGDVGEVVLNHLYANTQLQVVFGINMVALDKGQPRLFNLRDMLDCFIRHRREVVPRRSVYELRKARERAHILEGLAISLANIDEIIELIRRSPTPAEAKAGLIARAWQLGDVASMLETAGVDAARPDHLPEEYGIRGDNYHLTEEQAQAILDLRLHKLTGLEHEKILDEYKGLLEQIAELLHILNSSERLMEVIREELVEIRSNFGDERKTDITAAAHDISMEDLINEEDVVLTLSHEGYVKYQPLTEYEAQRRGGKGKAATKMKDEDFIERLWVANTHDTILCFSTRGRIYWMKVYQLPLASRASRGKPIVNLLPLEADERITAILPTRDYPEDKFVVMATRKGTIKKTPLPEYSRPRNGGIIALNLVDDDELIGVDITDGSGEIMLFSDAGKVVRFAEEQVRSMGRTATGVRGIRLEEGQRVVSLIVPREYEEEEANVLTVTENGYGKRTPLSEYPAKSRATKGVVSIKVSERNGSVVGAMEVIDGNEIMLISNKGTLVRTRVNEVSTVGRNTQGVRLIRTADDEKVVGLQRIDEIDEDEPLIDGEVIAEEGEVSSEDSSENQEGSDES
ncbi:MAG: DNA gyrase subunit A, partial [Idiomarina sp.]|nr:DNA gyrase subunit A [Idiomarina sp.]